MYVRSQKQEKARRKLFRLTKTDLSARCFSEAILSSLFLETLSKRYHSSLLFLDKSGLLVFFLMFCHMSCDLSDCFISVLLLLYQQFLWFIKQEKRMRDKYTMSMLKMVWNPVNSKSLIGCRILLIWDSGLKL